MHVDMQNGVLGMKWSIIFSLKLRTWFKDESSSSEPTIISVSLAWVPSVLEVFLEVEGENNATLKTASLKQGIPNYPCLT